MTKLRIAALGSSFAAGSSVEPIENQAAGRSSRNYAHQLAEKLNADLTDLTISGATLLTVLDQKQDVGWGQTFDPQLDHLSRDANIVTLTAGGNDLGYIGGMCHDSMLPSFGPVEVAFKLDRQQLTERFIVVIDKI